MDKEPEDISEKLEMMDRKLSDIHELVMSLHSRLDACKGEGAKAKAEATKREADRKNT